MLFFGLVHAADTIDAALDRSDDRRQESALALEDARHEQAKRLHANQDKREVDGNLNPAVECHE